MSIGKPPLRNTAERVLLARRHSNLKWYNLYGPLLSYQRLYEAWLKVAANKGAGGVDGISLPAFERSLEENLQQLLSDLGAKTYKPLPVLRRYI